MSVQTQGFSMTVPGQQSQRRDDIKLLEQGPNVGILYSIVDLGTHYNSFFKKSSHLIRLTWEFPLLMQLFNVNDTEERPTVVSTEETFQIAERSNLKKIIDGALGRVLQPNEYKNGYDIGQFLGKTMIVNIVNKASKKDPTKVYNNIGTIQGITEHVRNTYAFNWDMVQRHNDLQGFIIDPAGSCFQSDAFAKLPSFIRDKIMDSDEAKAYAEKGGTFIEQHKFENDKPKPQAPAGTPAPVQRAPLPQAPSSNIIVGENAVKLEWLNKDFDYATMKANNWTDQLLIDNGYCKVHVEVAPAPPQAPTQAPAPPSAPPVPVAPKAPVAPLNLEDDADGIAF